MDMTRLRRQGCALERKIYRACDLPMWSLQVDATLLEVTDALGATVRVHVRKFMSIRVHVQKFMSVRVTTLFVRSTL
jgi:hypothetical protein